MPHTSGNKYTINFFEQIGLGRALSVIIAISAAAFLFLIWLLYFNSAGSENSTLIAYLPALNALLNGASTILLLFGYRAILKRKYLVHMKFNLTAFVTSSLFLVSYIVYHSFHGDTHFTGQGVVKYIYFTILISHIVLSGLVVPMILTSFYLAFSGRIRTHRKVSKFTLPVWLYVSVTGVVIFFMLQAYVGAG